MSFWDRPSFAQNERKFLGVRLCDPPADSHLVLVRGVVERRPDVQLVSYHRWAYRRWLGCRPDSEQMRAEWAASSLARL
jgi:hypothetical protein